MRPIHAFLTLTRLCILIALVVIGTPTSLALITGSTGNQPVTNMGWPEGTTQVANLACRLGYWEGPPFGGGEYHFLYRSDAAVLNEALQLFARIRAPRLELLVRDGPNHSF